MVLGLALLGCGLVVAIAHASSSASFEMVRQQLTAGGDLQSSASFRVDACIAPEVGGLQASASYRVEVGCTAIAADPVPVELLGFVVE